jgi:hypothetical protein
MSHQKEVAEDNTVLFIFLVRHWNMSKQSSISERKLTKQNDHATPTASNEMCFCVPPSLPPQLIPENEYKIYRSDTWLLYTTLRSGELVTVVVLSVWCLGHGLDGRG